MSKGLKDFKELKKTTCFYCQYHINEECANGECIWNNIEKSLKALEIIRQHCEFGCAIPMPDMKSYYDLLVGKLTQEEYELLKEVLL